MIAHIPYTSWAFFKLILCASAYLGLLIYLGYRINRDSNRFYAKIDEFRNRALGLHTEAELTALAAELKKFTSEYFHHRHHDYAASLHSYIQGRVDELRAMRRNREHPDKWA